MMRISYSTAGDAYNRVMVVSPRNWRKNFSNISEFPFEHLNTNFSITTAQLFRIYFLSKNLLSLPSSIIGKYSINVRFFGKEREKNEYLIVISSQLLGGD